MRNFILLMVLSACAAAPMSPENVAKPAPVSPVIEQPKPEVKPVPVQGAVVTKGWHQDYTAYARAAVTETMLAFPTNSFCPKWDTLSKDELRDFWAAVLEATSFAETGFNRLDMYREDGQSVNRITGKRNTSEGLFQLSYGDKGCEDLFDYAKDREGFLADYARFPAKLNQAEISSQSPGRMILDPYRQLTCAVRIWTRLITASDQSTRFVDVGKQYWSTLNPVKPAYGEDTVPYFKKRFPKCGG